MLENFDLKFPFKLIFVTGAARTGTTVMHATLCTAKNANNYVPEATSFTNVAKLYPLLVPLYDLHHYGIFGNLGNFNLYIVNLMRFALIQIWEFLGKPEVLILKDPYLMYQLPLILQTIPEAKFVVCMRNPLDAAGSAKKVILKKTSDYQREFVQDVSFYRDFNSCAFSRVDLMPELYEKNVLKIKYEDFVQKTEFQKLNEFLGIEIDESKLWQDATTKKDETEFSTELLWNKIDASSVNSFKKVLTPDEIKFVLEVTQPILKQLGYEDYLSYSG